MALSFTVGGTRGTFSAPFADQVAGALDHAFGGEGDWEGTPPLHYGELALATWSELLRRAVAELGGETVPNLSALGEARRGVYVPAQVQAISLPVPGGEPLKCASLHGLRNELAELAQRWDLPLDDHGLQTLPGGGSRFTRRLGRRPARGRRVRAPGARGQRSHAPRLPALARQLLVVGRGSPDPAQGCWARVSRPRPGPHRLLGAGLPTPPRATPVVGRRSPDPAQGHTGCWARVS